VVEQVQDHGLHPHHRREEGEDDNMRLVSTRRGVRAGSSTGQKKEKGRRERWAELG
jgi:hypothetical protein